MTAHDGFTLRDLVSYNEKHNDANGEDGNDGESHNRSWNSGVEGDTDDPEVLSCARASSATSSPRCCCRRACRCSRTATSSAARSSGNNNTYAQDNELSWVHWDAGRPAAHRVHRRGRAAAQGPSDLPAQPVLRRPPGRERGEPRGRRCPTSCGCGPTARRCGPQDWDAPLGRAVGVFLNGEGIRQRDAPRRADHRRGLPAVLQRRARGRDVHDPAAHAPDVGRRDRHRGQHRGLRARRSAGGGVQARGAVDARAPRALRSPRPSPTTRSPRRSPCARRSRPRSCRARRAASRSSGRRRQRREGQADVAADSRPPSRGIIREGTRLDVPHPGAAVVRPRRRRRRRRLPARPRRRLGLPLAAARGRGRLRPRLRRRRPLPRSTRRAAAREALERAAAAARARGMGVLADIVPNHVGVATPAAMAWWWDVLANGRGSRYAEAFDIDWDFGGRPAAHPGARQRRRPRRAAPRARPTGASSCTTGITASPWHPAPRNRGDDPVAVHDRQHYELVDWRRADFDLNYRRFFAVNTLAGHPRRGAVGVRREPRRDRCAGCARGSPTACASTTPTDCCDPGGYLERLAEQTRRRLRARREDPRGRRADAAGLGHRGHDRATTRSPTSTACSSTPPARRR